MTQSFHCSGIHLQRYMQTCLISSTMIQESCCLVVNSGLLTCMMGMSVTLVHVSIDLNRVMSLRRPDCKESQGCWWDAIYIRFQFSNSACCLAWHRTPMHRSDASANPASLALVCCCLLTLVRLHPPIHSQLICLMRTAVTCNNSCSPVVTPVFVSIAKTIQMTIPSCQCFH